MAKLDINRFSTLELKLVPHHVEDDPNEYLVTELFIDGEPLADFDEYATDLSQLVESTQRNGQFFIITCWCGDAFCAGLHSPISIKHEWGRVFWNMKEPGSARWLIFDEQAYAEAIRAGAEEAIRLITGRREHRDTMLFEITPDQNRQYFEDNL